MRTSRSDDLPQFNYAKNDTVVDRVQILNNQIIEGSQSQMKFHGDLEGLLKDINEDTEKGMSEFSRYRGIKLELPSEQCNETYFKNQADKFRNKAAKKKPSSKEYNKLIEKADAYDQMKSASDLCLYKAKQLHAQADEAASKGAPPDVVKRLRDNAKNYENQAKNIVDSGLTTEQALFYRKHPKLATARDIALTSHRAGLEGAKIGGAVGGSISILTNALAVAQDQKQLGDAVKDVALDTGKAVAVGYATAATGSTIKSVMQQSSNQTLRTLSATNAPALAVQVCISLSSSVKRYVTGEISEAQLLSEVSEKGAGILSASMMTVVGQLAIPIPIVGAAIGSMIGYALSSFFYQSALEAAQNLELSREQLARIKAIETAARERIAEEQAVLDDFTRREIPQLRQETQRLFTAVSSNTGNADTLAHAINHYATLLGKNLQFQTLSEFDDFMKSDQPLTL